MFRQCWVLQKGPIQNLKVIGVRSGIVVLPWSFLTLAQVSRKKSEIPLLNKANTFAQAS